MTKGADSIMLPRCQAREETIEILQDHLNKFAKEGLRTLVMGQKEISLGEFQNFKKEFDSIKISNDKNKEKKLVKLYDEMESNLDLLGASAIEDKLQKGVPETIFKLMEADIRIWVLTGDKQVMAQWFSKKIITGNCNRDWKILQIDPRKYGFVDIIFEN